MSNGGIIGPVNIPTTNTASGIWTLEEQQLAKTQNIWPTVTSDPYFEYTTLLLPGNGTNGAQNNTFLDGSTNNFTITRNGNTTQGTFSPFSQTGWGNYFDGTGDSLSVASNAAFAFGTSDFSVEFWINPSISSPANFTKYICTGSASGNFVLDQQTTANQITVNDNTAVILTSSSYTLTPFSWNHVVVTRGSGTLRIFINGVLTNSVANSTSFTQAGAFLGSSSSNTVNITGYLSNVRIVKGSVPTTYQTSSTTAGATIFAPPTTPLTTSSEGTTAANVSLLTCQSNRFIDNSTNNFTITRNGDTRVVAFSPFNPTASWSAATYGGSGYFDGSGDYLTTPSSTSFAFGGNWTIEFWFYPLSQSSSGGLIAFSDDKDNIDYTLSSNSLIYYNGSTATTFTGVSVTVSAWNHIAVVNSSGTVRAYVNGSQSTNSGSGVTTSSARSFNILANVPGSAITRSYVSSLRVVNGTAVYTGAFTPPTAPISTSGSASASAYPSTTNVNTSFASSDTKLLLNCTNAGIYDATSKNDLETVGNAQISTTQSKWGGSSISFDGTGDWLLIPDQPLQRIGTGNFTVEMWVYRNSSGTYGLAGKGTGTTGWLVSLNSSNQVVFTYGSSTITSSGTVSATTWTHIAVVREGTSTNQTKIYINGTNDGTGTVSTDFNQTNSMYIGADRTGGSAANAYVQDVRITNFARYTANFAGPLLSPFLTL